MRLKEVVWHLGPHPHLNTTRENRDHQWSHRRTHILQKLLLLVKTEMVVIFKDYVNLVNFLWKEHKTKWLYLHGTERNNYLCNHWIGPIVTDLWKVFKLIGYRHLFLISCNRTVKRQVSQMDRQYCKKKYQELSTIQLSLFRIRLNHCNTLLHIFQSNMVPGGSWPNPRINRLWRTK